MSTSNAKLAWALFWLGVTSPLWVTGLWMLVEDQENGTLATAFLASIALAFVTFTGAGIYMLRCPAKEKWTWWIVAMMLGGVSLAAAVYWLVHLGHLEQ